MTLEMNSSDKAGLRHAFWIGGPSDAGKTTVARLLVQRRRWQWYPCDLHEHNHLIARADPVSHPNIHRAIGRSFDENRVHPTPQQLFDQALATNEESFRAKFLARDRLLADYIGSEVVKLGLPYLEVDCQRTVEEIADSIQSHFANYSAYV